MIRLINRPRSRDDIFRSDLAWELRDSLSDLRGQGDGVTAQSRASVKSVQSTLNTGESLSENELGIVRAFNNVGARGVLIERPIGASNRIEDNVASWSSSPPGNVTFTGGQADPFGGTDGVLVEGTVIGDVAYYVKVTEPVGANVYRAAVWARTPTGQGAGKMLFAATDTDQSSFISVLADVTEDWQLVLLPAEAINGTGVLLVAIYPGDSATVLNDIIVYLPSVYKNLGDTYRSFQPAADFADEALRLNSIDGSPVRGDQGAWMVDVFPLSKPAHTDDESYGCIIGYHSGNSGSSIEIKKDGANTKLQAVFDDNQGNSQTIEGDIDDDNFGALQWHRVIVRWDADNVHLFLNGVLLETAATAAPGTDPMGAGADIRWRNNDGVVVMVLQRSRLWRYPPPLSYLLWLSGQAGRM